MNDDLERYMKEVRTHHLLTHEEEIRLSKLRISGDPEAALTLAIHNLRLVVSVAASYTDRCGLTVADRIAEGNLGLLKAAERYDWTHQTRFSTYGVFWIRQAIRRAIHNKGKTIRLPANVQEKITKLNKAAASLAQELQRDPTNQEILEEIGMSNEEFVRIHRANITTLSIETQIGDDENQTLKDIIADPTSIDAAQQSRTNDLMAFILNAMDGLTEKEKIVLQHRYGLNGYVEKTLEETGSRLDITRERVRQIENAAIKKIRAMARRYGDLI
jgi:RNA polymerase primary sigma factor